jgi:parvulin-like peptidyl-prolyl isomerase
MNTCLKIGNRRLGGDEIIAALVRYKLLEPLIGQILLDDAIKDITLTEQELLRALAGVTYSEVPDDFASFVQQWCENAGVTAEYFQAVVLRELQVQKFKQLHFGNQVVTEFLKTRSELDQVEYSLLQLNDLSLAQELYFLLRDDGADFAQLVEQYSSDLEFDRPSGLSDGQPTQGWIGPVSLSTLPVEVATLFRQGKPGAIYGPIAVADRFWIVRLEKLMLARLTDTTWLQLLNRLFDRWLKTQVQSFLSTPDTVAVVSDS